MNSSRASLVLALLLVIGSGMALADTDESWERARMALRGARIEVPLNADETAPLDHYFLVLRAEYQADLEAVGAVIHLVQPDVEPIRIGAEDFQADGPELIRAQIPPLGTMGPIYLELTGSLRPTRRFQLMEPYASRQAAVHDLRFVETW